MLVEHLVAAVLIVVQHQQDAISKLAKHLVVVLSFLFSLPMKLSIWLLPFSAAFLTDLTNLNCCFNFTIVSSGDLTDLCCCWFLK